MALVRDSALWKDIQDAALKKRVQNRLAQRRYRQRVKERRGDTLAVGGDSLMSGHLDFIPHNGQTFQPSPLEMPALIARARTDSASTSHSGSSNNSNAGSPQEHTDITPEVYIDSLLLPTGGHEHFQGGAVGANFSLCGLYNPYEVDISLSTPWDFAGAEDLGSS